MQISKFSYKHPQYPDLLREIDRPPKALYVLGELPKGPAVAIVGTRRPTAYGRQVTYKLAYDLAAAGMVIISGLALGLDGVAHQAAVEAGGQTVAVLGTAINKLYPASHRGLANRILDGHGAVISEYSPDHAGHKGMFPERNRIISGLALATIVTEADAESGSLITANSALKQNRLVMAVPGNITSQRSAGPNNLIRAAGTVAVTSYADVLHELNLGNIAQRPIRAKSAEEAAILELLTSGVSDTQALIEQSKLTASEFANIISLMEITGKVRNLGAGVWVTK